jgi:hypothetical protein
VEFAINVQAFKRQAPFGSVIIEQSQANRKKTGFVPVPYTMEEANRHTKLKVRVNETTPLSSTSWIVGGRRRV